MLLVFVLALNMKVQSEIRWLNLDYVLDVEIGHFHNDRNIGSERITVRRRGITQAVNKEAVAARGRAT
jgi:hypothetical protein